MSSPVCVVVHIFESYVSSVAFLGRECVLVVERQGDDGGGELVDDVTERCFRRPSLERLIELL